MSYHTHMYTTCLCTGIFKKIATLMDPGVSSNVYSNAQGYNYEMHNDTIDANTNTKHYIYSLKSK